MRNNVILDFLKKHAVLISLIFIVCITITVFFNGYKKGYTNSLLFMLVFILLMDAVDFIFFSKNKRISAKSEWSILGAGILSVIFFILSFIKENSEVYTFFLLNTSIVFLIDIWYVKLYDLNGDF